MQTQMADLRILICGDPMLDVWVEGVAASCPDGCLAFREGPPVVTPGGAANAARQLAHWPGVEVQLVGPVDRDVRKALANVRIGLQYALFPCPQNPVKRRCLSEDGRVLWRCDREVKNHGLPDAELTECQDLALKAVRECRWDAVLLSDYGKGFMGVGLCHEILVACKKRGIPVVADSKWPPWLLGGAILQCNSARAAHWGWSQVQQHPPAAVVTCGSRPPLVFGEPPHDPGPDTLPPVVCRNHIGAGDCFAAHLVRFLAHGHCLADAVMMAHSAGRVFVQHRFGRPPWPHEVWKDHQPVTGKVVPVVALEALRESFADRKVVFANGVWRIPSPGHAWLLDWARKQGDVLVVGINDDTSAALLRPGKHVLPLAQRLEVLGGLAAVDWLVPFHESTPEAIMEVLRPDVLVKGAEYRGRTVPGAGLVREVLFPPDGPHLWHCSDLEAALART